LHSIRNKMEKIIKDRLSPNLKLIDIFFKKIEEYEKIAIFRHEKPDYDALGSQMGLYTFIKDNWPNKEIIYVGDNMVGLNDQCFPQMMEVDSSWFDQKFLGIVLDLSNLERISEGYTSRADYLIKVDHHPLVEHFGDIEIVDETMAAVGEFLASILLTKPEYKISDICAQYLFKAIVGDSGRFLYSETSVHTFYVSQKLLETGFDLNKAYHEIYDKDQKSLEVRSYILKHYKITKNGVAYYILKDKILKKYNLLPSQGKDNINIFANFKGINAWMSISQDVKKSNWRVSIRSGREPIDGIAYKYGGGGHAQASATKLKTLKECMELISEIDSLFK